MIERDSDVPAGIDAVRAVGTLTRHDYDTVVVPILDAAVREGRRLRFLCVVDEDFHGLTPDGMWADVKLGLTAMRNLEGCAVVSDLTWVRDMTQLAAFFLPGHVRVFDAVQREEALRWLEALPGRLATTRTDPAAGVVVADVGQPLRREDVEVIATAVDSWLADHTEGIACVIGERLTLREVEAFGQRFDIVRDQSQPRDDLGRIGVVHQRRREAQRTLDVGA